MNRFRGRRVPPAGVGNAVAQDASDGGTGGGHLRESDHRTVDATSDGHGDPVGGLVERRIGSRAEVELEARWRRAGTSDAPTLALLFDLSVRGARLAGWNPLRLDPGEHIELWLEDGSTWSAEVRRAIGDGEYAVQFVEVPHAVKQRIIATVGIAKAGQRTRWATG